jgi:hypothetical protein
MDLDLTASSKSTRLVWEVNSGSNRVQMFQSRLPITRLSSEQTRLVHKVLVAFGQALGPKQGAFVVDSLLSDIFEAWHRENLSLSMVGRWAGSIAVATQVCEEYILQMIDLLYRSLFTGSILSASRFCLAPFPQSMKTTANCRPRTTADGEGS